MFRLSASGVACLDETAATWCANLPIRRLFPEREGTKVTSRIVVAEARRHPAKTFPPLVTR